MSAPPVAAPGASIDSSAFRDMLFDYSLMPHSPVYIQRVVEYIDAHAAQHYEAGRNAGIKLMDDMDSPLLERANRRAEAAEASLARLVKGIASAQQYAEAAQGGMYATRYGDYFRVSDINALLPAKADKTDSDKEGSNETI